MYLNLNFQRDFGVGGGGWGEVASYVEALRGGGGANIRQRLY